jgi:PAS domain S-box-containing protein
MNTKQKIPYPPNNPIEPNQKDTRANQDLVLITFIAIIVFILAHVFKVFSVLIVLSEKYGDTQVDKIMVVLMMLGIAFGIFSWRRWRDLNKEVRLHRQTEQKLHESEERLKAQYQGIPIPTYTWQKQDSDFVLIDCNRAAGNITRGKIRQFLGTTLQEMYGNKPEILADFEKCFTEKSIITKEIQYQLQSTAETKDFNISYSYIAPDIILVHTEDITQRKQLQEEMRRNQIFLDSIVENIPSMVFVKEVENLQFVRFNRAGEELLGYTRNEMLGKNDFDLFPQEDAAFFIAKDHEVLEGRKLVDISEEPIETKYKGSRILHTKKVPIYNETGKPQYLLGISEDITAQKLTEEKLKRRETSLRALLNATTETIFLLDTKGIIIAINEIAANRFGKNVEELIGTNIFDHLQPEVANRRKQLGDLILTSRRPLRFEDERNGVYFDNNIYPILDATGNVEKVAVFARDITAQKQAEKVQKVLSALGEKLASALDPKEVATATLTAADELFGWDASTIDILDENEEETVRITAYDTVNGERKEFPSAMGKNTTTPLFKKIIREGSQLILAGESELTLETELIPFGETSQKSASMMFVPIKKENQNIGFLTIQSYRPHAYDSKDLELLQTIVDYGSGALERAITRHKLLETEESLSTLMNATFDSITLIDTSGMVLAANNVLASRLHKPVDAIIGTKLFDLIPLEISQQRKQYIEKVIQTGTPVQFEDERDGMWSIHNLYPILNSEEKVDRIAIFAQDITERKHAEKIQKTFSELGEKLGSALDPKEVATATLTAADELFGWDASAVDIFADNEEEVVTITAYDTVDSERQEFPLGMGKNIITSIFKKTIQEGPQLILRENEEPLPIRGLVSFGNTTKKSASLMFVPIKKENKNMGVLTIQSYRLQAYNAKDLELLQTIVNYGSGALERAITRIKLLESEGRNRRLVELSPYPIMVYSEGKVVLTNRATLAVMGLNDSRKMLGKSVWDFIDPDYQNVIQERIRTVIEDGKKTPLIEIKLKRPDGTSFDAEIVSIPLIYQGKPSALVMGRDISQRKLQENEIRQYQEQLRELNTELSLTEERDRRQIAQSLHDNIGQILALGKIKLGELTADTKSSQLAAEIRELMDQAIQYTRSLTLELSPPILYEVGFEPAIEWLAEQIQTQYNLPIQVTDDFQPKPLDPELRVLLYQVVRELLINVGKHSQAQQAMISLERDLDTIKIIVADNGIGFEVAEQESQFWKTKNYGLFSVRERLLSIGGKMQIDSHQNKGTQITIVVPLKKAIKN